MITNRNTDPDVLKWIKRLERVLRDVPSGVTLYGMDSDLLLVDEAAADDAGVNTPKGFLGNLENENSNAITTLRTGKAYTDSGGW